jgi:4-amino-4-deoxy-L-arabinose transferase-like glycosyltransferase
MKSFEKFYPFLLVAGILLNANALFREILEPDGALYATLSKHIVLSNDWVNLIGNGDDWLDKPHLPFWITAASFKLFGVTAFAYKLPAFVFWLIGTWFTFKLAAALYDTYAAKIAVIIYVFSLHGLLNNFDVRAEPYLTTLSIGAIYCFYRAYLIGKWRYIIFTAFLAACAVMTKGIFVLVTIAGGFVIYWMITKQWRQFINFRWWIMLLLILLFITPELYSLYLQFDLHPEKVIFGKTDVSGIKFFFWDSQFGRFFNTGPITGRGEKTFFLHSTIWAYLPWSVLLFVAVFNLFRGRGSSKDKSSIRGIIYGSAAITFTMFSLSSFQLPHYITILFPHFSIITAGYLAGLKREKSFSSVGIIQWVILVLCSLIIIVLSAYTQLVNPLVAGLISGTFVLLCYVFSAKTGVNKVILPAVATSLLVFVFLFNFFYPKLLTFQSGMMAGKWLKENNFTQTPAMYNAWSYSFEFYAPGYISYIRSEEELKVFIKMDSNRSIYTKEAFLSELQSQGYKFKLLQTFPNFHVSMLTPEFLNPKTRDKAVEKFVLIKIHQQ